MKWEFGINIITLLYVKEINSEDRLYSTGSYIQCLMITYIGKESEKKNIYIPTYYLGLPRWLSGKESTCQAEDAGSIPGLGRFPGERIGNPLQYSCLRNLMDRGAWWATVHRVTRVRQDSATKPPPHIISPKLSTIFQLKKKKVVFPV